MGLIKNIGKRRLFWRAQLDAWLHGYKIGRNSKLYPGAQIRRTFGGSITIGRKAIIHSGAMLLAQGGRIEIGDHVSINRYCVIYGNGGLRIGNDVRIAAHTVIVPANHIFSDPDVPFRLQGETAEGITIEDDVWVAAGVRILDGVTIGRGGVMAAGAVVTKSTEPYGIYGGVPAKLIGWRKKQQD